MKQFLVLPYSEETGLALPGLPEALVMDKDDKTVPTKATGSILARGREYKLEILV
jgi:hypothetical protein